MGTDEKKHEEKKNSTLKLQYLETLAIYKKHKSIKYLPIFKPNSTISVHSLR